MSKQRIRNLIFFGSLILLVFILQFILAKKHLEYGFNNDDWYVLAWYKQVVGDPILDMMKAWKQIGPHNFVHAYYIGIMFEFFKLNYPLYHIINTLIKALAVLSLFPVVYLLFRNKFLAFLATILFAFHFSPFGVIFHVIGGEGSLVVISMNLFLAVYIYASQKTLLNNIKILLILLILLLATAFFEVTRAYPVILFLPFLELLNFWFGKSQRNFKASLLRLLFFYSPFIALVIYHPSALSEINFNKFIRAIDWGNFQLFLTIFSSFGSTFVPEGLIDQLTLFGKVGQDPLYKDLGTFLTFLVFRFLIIAIPVLFIIKSLANLKSKWILSSLFLNICFFILAFWFANHWLNLDPKLRAPVDPSTYFIPSLIGLFIFSTAISFFISWLTDGRRNTLLLALSLAPIFSLIYTFLTWILVDDNTIFMGVHAYLSIAAIGSSVYLAIICYLAFQKLRFGPGIIRRIAGNLTILYFLLFIILSAQQIDKYYSFWLINGYAASDQKRIQDSFWREVGREESKDKSPILVYLDTSADDGYFYGANFTWDIPPLLTVVKGLDFEPGGHCRSMISYKDFNKLRIETVNGKKMVVQGACGDDRFYKLENFFAFKMVNRNLKPIKSEILNKLEIQ